MKYKIGDEVILLSHSNDYFRAYKEVPIDTIGFIENFSDKDYFVKFNNVKYGVYVKLEVICLLVNHKELLEEIIDV